MMVASSLSFFSESGFTPKEFEDAESLSFTGTAVVHLAADPDVIKRTGKIQLSSQLAEEYGFVDEDGKIHGKMPAGWRNIFWNLQQ